MKGVYWRPRRIPRAGIALVALSAVLAAAAVECFPRREPTPYYQDKIAAAQLARRCMDAIRAERLRRGLVIDPALDPAGTGLIGLPNSPITSIAGDLRAKQTAANPNLAAAVVDMLRTAGVGPGDCVAVGYSGSFPGANLAVCAALETLRARPVIIASVGASQYGANRPELLWIDMERLLHRQGLISFRSVAASIGGREDRGLGMTEAALEQVRRSICAQGLPLIESRTFAESVEERMSLYRRHAGGMPVKAYINAGGGTVSIGYSLGESYYRPGLNLTLPEEVGQLDGVMPRMARQGVPIIHLEHFRRLASQYGLPVAPSQVPEVGDGPLFVRVDRDRVLAGLLLTLVLVLWRSILFGRLGRQIALWTQSRRRPALQYLEPESGLAASAPSPQQNPLELMV